MKVLKAIDFTNPETQEALTNLVKDAVRVEFGEAIEGSNMNDTFLNFGTEIFLNKKLEDLTWDDLK